MDGVTCYGTQGAKDSIESGSAYAITQGLYESYGADFHGGPNMAHIDTVVSGTVNLAGIDFNLIDHGESYDLEIPALNVIYTHMLGKTSHSILAGTDHMDAMAETFTAAMKEAFPGYSGENYLEMTAGNLYP